MYMVVVNYKPRVIITKAFTIDTSGIFRVRMCSSRWQSIATRRDEKKVFSRPLHIVAPDRDPWCTMRQFVFPGTGIHEWIIEHRTGRWLLYLRLRGVPTVASSIHAPAAPHISVLIVCRVGEKGSLDVFFFLWLKFLINFVRSRKKWYGVILVRMDALRAIRTAGKLTALIQIVIALLLILVVILWQQKKWMGGRFTHYFSLRHPVGDPLQDWSRPIFFFFPWQSGRIPASRKI